jgi:hypothetical protein
MDGCLHLDTPNMVWKDRHVAMSGKMLLARAITDASERDIKRAI